MATIKKIVKLELESACGTTVDLTPYLKGIAINGEPMVYFKPSFLQKLRWFVVARLERTVKRLERMQ